MNVSRLLVWVAVGLLGVGGCGSTGPTVVTDSDPAAPFAAFRTFAFSGISDRGREVGPADTSPVRNRVKGMVRDQLTAKGLREVGLDGRPDVLVHLFYGVKDLVHVERGGTMPGVYSAQAKAYSYHDGTWTPVSVTHATTHEDHEGTLILDVADAAKNKLVWRAVIRANLKDSMPENLGLARQGIADAFKQYPASR